MMEDSKESKVDLEKIPRRRIPYRIEVWDPQTQTWIWTSTLDSDQSNHAARKSLQKLKRLPQYRDTLNEQRVRVTQSEPQSVSQYKVGFKEPYESRKQFGFTHVPTCRRIPKASWPSFDSYPSHEQNGVPEDDLAEPPESHQDPQVGH